MWYTPTLFTPSSPNYVNTEEKVNIQNQILFGLLYFSVFFWGGGGEGGDETRE